MTYISRELTLTVNRFARILNLSVYLNNYTDSIPKYKSSEEYKMSIIWHEETKQFHLCNKEISYIMCVQPTGELGQLYFGTRLNDKADMTYLLIRDIKAMIAGMPSDEMYSMELNRQEYPSFGTTDFRGPAFEVEYPDGSTVSNFAYESHEIYKGKKALLGLPATFGDEEEVESLDVVMRDRLSGVSMILSYSLWNSYPVITRSVRFVNTSDTKIVLTKVLSLCLDLPDYNYEWMQFSGAWGRERTPIVKKLEAGTTLIESRRGHSSPNHNPFVILKRPTTDEFVGEAIGFSFVYSGNFIASAEVDVYDRLRFMMGIHPDKFAWPLEAGESFTAPEVIMTRSEAGLNGLSNVLHKLYLKHLIRGKVRNSVRPILLNNWEATFMDFDRESILKIASKAKEAGAELFVLDDGWFGARDDDHAGLGDWVANPKKLPEGIAGLARDVNNLGLEFGFWIEPEMVNADSDMFRNHPDWVLSVPGRDKSLGRHQMVLDYSKEEVVDNLYEQLYAVLKDAPVSYIKWDMNRSITECFSIGMEADKQGMVYHKYILGVYSLYERLRAAFPNILFESCSSGGARYDAGMLYYAPQTWCSDDTDAGERMKIQYGTSYGYPISSIGSHVSAVPNQQTGRSVSIATRANVAYFGTFGYELDLNHVSDEEFEEVKKQISFMKEYRDIIQLGSFYRLASPFDSDIMGWMVVSEDKSKAVLGCYQLNAEVNGLVKFMKLYGLNPNRQYKLNGNTYGGDELMKIGILMNEKNLPGYKLGEDYSSAVVIIEAI